MDERLAYPSQARRHKDGCCPFLCQMRYHWGRVACLVCTKRFGELLAAWRGGVQRSPSVLVPSYQRCRTAYEDRGPGLGPRQSRTVLRWQNRWPVGVQGCAGIPGGRHHQCPTLPVASGWTKCSGENGGVLLTVGDRSTNQR